MHLGGPRYFGVVWTQIFGTFSSGLNIAWISLACTDSGERALAMAMIIMAANIAGIYGAHILRADDAPRYRCDFGIDIAIIAFPVALASFRYPDDLRHRRRNSGQLTVEYSSDDIESNEDIKAARSSDMQPVPVLVEGDLQSYVSKSLKLYYL
ncbi:hypothetical protein WAI453_006388 [Rhynchosporium graminicola]